MDDTRPAGHSSNLDNKSDRGAHERVDPLRNGRSTRTENVLGNPFRPWIAAWCDRSSRSDESTSREIGTGRTCPDWKIPGRRSVLKPAEVEGGHGNGKSETRAIPWRASSLSVRVRPLSPIAIYEYAP